MSLSSAPIESDERDSAMKVVKHSFAPMIPVRSIEPSKKLPVFTVQGGVLHAAAPFWAVGQKTEMLAVLTTARAAGPGLRQFRVDGWETPGPQSVSPPEPTHSKTSMSATPPPFVK